MSWTQDRIQNRIYNAVQNYTSRDCVNPQQYRQIKFALGKLSSAAVFETLFRSIVEAPAEAEAALVQEYAGRLLLGLAPPAPGDAGTSIRALIEVYDLSCEELPWYFADQLGKEELLAHLRSIERKVSRPEKIRALKTWKFWINAQRSQKEY